MKILAVAFLAAMAVQAAEFNVRDFGAAKDAAPAANAAAIQRAIDAAAKDGGGRVVVPSGTFTSGTIWLKPNVELHLSEGSVLKASGDVADYNAEDAYPENWGCPPEQWRGLHFIIVREADGASITGPGTLHGNGNAFYDEKPKAYFSWMKPGASCWWNGIRWSKDKEKLRPGQLVAFVKCRNVAVRGITIRNSPCWSLWFWGCDGVQVSDYTVRNGENDGNSDGIDFDCSRNVVLERADIDTGDDAIAVRASARAFSPDGKGRLGLPAVTENVRIRDCRLRSTSSVFRIGVGEGTIRDVSVDNVTCDRGGTAVNISTRYGEPKRAGTDIERVMFRNCHFTNCRAGAVVRSNGGDHLEFGIRDIRFENCSFGGCKPVVQSDRGVKFPVSLKDVAFVFTHVTAEHGGEPVVFDKKTTGAEGVVTLTVAAGTPLRRVRDEARAALAAHPGRPLVVSLAEGVYPVTETVGLSLVDSGTPAAPVTWRGEGRGAVFSGAARLGAWRAVGDGTWRAAVPREADGRPMWAADFFANGVRRPNAAYPSDGRFIHATNITERILAKTYGERDYSVKAEHTLFLNEDDFRHVAAIPDAELKFAHVRIHSKWNASRHFIMRIDRAAGSVTIQGTRWPPWNRYKAKECPLRIENLRTELRSPGDWFYDATAGELAYVPMKGEEPGTVEGTIPCDGIDVFLRLAGDIDAEKYAGNMRFENIVFRHGSTLARKGPADVPDSLMLGAVVRGMFLADGARNVVFDGCRWEETGGAYGVWFREGCMSNAVINCTFRDLGGGAVRVGVNGGIRAVKGLADKLENVGPFPFRAYVPHSTAFITVENNLVERGGRYMPGAGAIVVGAASDCRIVHNRIDDLHYTAIMCNWDFGYRGSPCQRCLVAFNHISRVGHGDLSDMGGVYMAGSGFGNVVARNVIHGVDGMVYGGWGLYPDEGTEGVLYESNLVYDTKDGGIHQHFGRDNVVRNNIFAFSREGQVAITRPEPHRSWVFEGNIVVWEKGDAFAKYNGTKSEKAIVDWKRNLWWRLDGQTNVFNGRSFSEWQAKGKDVDGLYANPLFVDAARRDFRFRDVSVVRKIGFRPFDFTRAGLYKPGVKVQPVYDTSLSEGRIRESCIRQNR